MTKQNVTNDERKQCTYLFKNLNPLLGLIKWMMGEAAQVCAIFRFTYITRDKIDQSLIAKKLIKIFQTNQEMKYKSKFIQNLNAHKLKIYIITPNADINQNKVRKEP